MTFIAHDHLLKLAFERTNNIVLIWTLSMFQFITMDYLADESWISLPFTNDMWDV